MAAGIRWAAVRISAGSASATSRGRKSTTISCAPLDLVVDPLLDLGAEVGGHRRKGEDKKALEWLHVAARHRDAVVRPDDAAQDVQGRVGGQPLEASGPVDLSADLGADLKQGAGVGRDSVPDQPGLPAYAGDRHGALGTGQGSGVMRAGRSPSNKKQSGQAGCPRASTMQLEGPEHRRWSGRRRPRTARSRPGWRTGVRRSCRGLPCPRVYQPLTEARQVVHDLLPPPRPVVQT